MSIPVSAVDVPAVVDMLLRLLAHRCVLTVYTRKVLEVLSKRRT